MRGFFKPAAASGGAIVSDEHTAGSGRSTSKRPRRGAAARGLAAAAAQRAREAEIKSALSGRAPEAGAERSPTRARGTRSPKTPAAALAAAAEAGTTEDEDEGALSYVAEAYRHPGSSAPVSLPCWSAVCAAALPRPVDMPATPHERRAALKSGGKRSGGQRDCSGSSVGEVAHWPGAVKEVEVWLPAHRDVALRHVDRKSKRDGCTCALCLKEASHGRKNGATSSHSSEADLDALWADVKRAEDEDGVVFMGRKLAQKAGWKDASGTHWTSAFRKVKRRRFEVLFDSDKDAIPPTVAAMWRNLPTTDPARVAAHVVMPRWNLGFHENAKAERDARKAARAAVARYRELERDASGTEAARKAKHDNAIKKASGRPDLKARKLMHDEDRCFPIEVRDKIEGGGWRVGQRAGAVPGLPPGLAFSCRAESMVVGMHDHWLHGMCSGYSALENGQPKGKQPHVRFLASLQSSGGYDGDEDGGDFMTYTGSGGNDLLHDGKQIGDQVLSDNNAALASSAELGIPVRVLRKQAARGGTRAGVGPTGRKEEIVYDGLYVCTRYYNQVGISGYLECKYHLQRLPGQPPLETSSVHFKAKGGIKAMPSAMTPDMRAGFTGIWDITLGLGSVHPIPVINEYRHASPPPPLPVFLKPGNRRPDNSSQGGFQPWDETRDVDEAAVGQCAFYYAAEQVMAPCAKAKLHPTPAENLAKVEDDRALVKLNGVGMPTYSSRGLLQNMPHTVVYEGPRGGPQSVVGRAANITLRLEVYRTDSRGWGVRCWDAIKPGTFVAPFTGEVCHCDTIDARNAAAGAAEEGTEALYSAQEYQFDLEVKAVDQYLGINNAVDMDRDECGASGEAVFKQSGLSKEQVEEDGFVLDGKYYGSVARFINHSDEPNLMIQAVLLPDSHDCRLVQLALFAQEHIPPMTELTYFYSEDYMKQLQTRGRFKSVMKIGSR